MMELNTFLWWTLIRLLPLVHVVPDIPRRVPILHHHPMPLTFLLPSLTLMTRKPMSSVISIVGPFACCGTNALAT